MGALPAPASSALQTSGFPGLHCLDQAARYRFYHKPEEAAAADFSSLEQSLIVFGSGCLVQQVYVSLSGYIIAMPVLAFQLAIRSTFMAPAANRALKHSSRVSKVFAFFNNFSLLDTESPFHSIERNEKGTEK